MDALLNEFGHKLRIMDSINCTLLELKREEEELMKLKQQCEELIMELDMLDRLLIDIN